MEHFPVESGINSKIKIFPMPVVTLVVLRQSLSFYQFSWEEKEQQLSKFV